MVTTLHKPLVFNTKTYFVFPTMLRRRFTCLSCWFQKTTFPFVCAEMQLQKAAW
uniref:Uncharacterized protein n=1 Tax=Anguilla anguilla TaxID=7936 RepID=A0A0E9WM92_ANGAN